MISFIVLSYDGYEDCWNPFFHFLKKHFPESKDFEIILSTTTKNFEIEGLEIKTLAHGNDASWGRRLRLSMLASKYDVVLPLSEDYFLKSKVNFERFNYLIDLIYNNDEIDHIRLLRYRVLWKGSKSKFQYLEKIKPITKHRFLLIPALWKKKVLLKYIKDYEDPFMSEKIGGFRSWIFRHGFYSIDYDYVHNFGQAYNTWNSGFVFKGKLVPWGLEYLENEGIALDSFNRDVLSKDEMEGTRLQSKINILKNPLSSFKSFYSVFILFLKSLFGIRE